MLNIQEVYEQYLLSYTVICSRFRTIPILQRN